MLLNYVQLGREGGEEEGSKRTKCTGNEYSCVFTDSDFLPMHFSAQILDFSYTFFGLPPVVLFSYAICHPSISVV